MRLSRSPRSVRLGVELFEDRLTPSWAAVPPAAVPVPTAYTTVAPDAAYQATGTASISAGEVDWYKVTVQAGQTTALATTPGSSLNTVVGLYSSAGARLTSNNDRSATDTDSRVYRTLTAGTYYLGVTNLTGTAGSGSYTWSFTTPPPEDAYEENDTQAAAADLGTLSVARAVSGLALADANDWFKFTTTAAGTGSVSLAFSNALGNLSLRLYDSGGRVLATSAGSGDTETVSLAGRPAGTYWVRVYGVSSAFNPNYTLTVTPPVVVAPGAFSITLRTTGMTPTQEVIFQQAADRWAQVITADLPDTTYGGVFVDDLLIDASAVAIDGAYGVLGSAGPDALRAGSRLPYHGEMEFDTADLARLESDGGLFSTVLHEMGHVLGIGTLWGTLGLLTGAGGSDPRFIGPRATAEYNALFGRAEAGVPVENTGGPGTRDGHWRESVFDEEVMTGTLDTGVNPLSRITVASLADMGYTVDLAAADPFAP
ncbi:MAG: pre-peptidase C-terminal domain-containing protein [Gemmataceae bacterium]|nr:pre-peptidase C-terminal domain-containing protein [Gemmataceae bacterium]